MFCELFPAPSADEVAVHRDKPQPTIPNNTDELEEECIVEQPADTVTRVVRPAINYGAFWDEIKPDLDLGKARESSHWQQDA
jgi:hypothetical protein